MSHYGIPIIIKNQLWLFSVVEWMTRFDHSFQTCFRFSLQFPHFLQKGQIWKSQANQKLLSFKSTWNTFVSSNDMMVPSSEISNRILLVWVSCLLPFIFWCNMFSIAFSKSHALRWGKQENIYAEMFFHTLANIVWCLSSKSFNVLEAEGDIQFQQH